MDDEQEVVKLLESLHESLHNGEDEGEEDSSQRPVGADVDTPQGGGEDSGLTTEMAEGEEREVREEPPPPRAPRCFGAPHRRLSVVRA